MLNKTMIDNRFKKYEFKTSDLAKKMVKQLTENEEVKEKTYISIVELGHLTIENTEYDEQGNEIKEAVINDKYSVDVIWKNEEDKDWQPYRIVLGSNKSSHTFLGYEYKD